MSEAEQDRSQQLAALLKKLAANDRPARESGVEKLEQYLDTEEEIPALDFLKMWKGLYYTMWMTDRPKVQQAMATRLGRMQLGVGDHNVAGFVDAFWATICRDWNNIDVLRIDKYYLLIRRFVSGMFERLANSNWDQEMITSFNKSLMEYPLNPKNTAIADGIRYHMIDIFVEEFEKKMAELTDNAGKKKDSEESDGESAEEEEDEEKSKVPFNELMKPFENLAQNSISKVVKKRVYDEVLDLPHLEKVWGYKKSIGPKPSTLDEKARPKKKAKTK
ncbi:hypothetical protein BZA70DRAFT_279118 [Myxozyma melibiosi]|uniref:Nop52-domain-containing protein n=1 Tax=Myxozyma melibiosi TaxID=54550 RepID=A0ABR1F7M7_9ASCO